MTRFGDCVKSVLVSVVLIIMAVSAPLPARSHPTRSHPARSHVFRLDSLREPLSVVAVVMERDGGSLVVSLQDADGKKDGCEFNYKMNQDHGPNSAYGRLYADEWLVPLGSPIQDKVARAVRRYVAGPGKKDRLAGYLLSDVNYLEQLRKSTTTIALAAQAGRLYKKRTLVI